MFIEKTPKSVFLERRLWSPFFEHKINKTFPVEQGSESLARLAVANLYVLGGYSIVVTKKCPPLYNFKDI